MSAYKNHSANQLNEVHVNETEECMGDVIYRLFADSLLFLCHL